MAVNRSLKGRDRGDGCFSTAAVGLGSAVSSLSDGSSVVHRSVRIVVNACVHRSLNDNHELQTAGKNA